MTLILILLASSLAFSIYKLVELWKQRQNGGKVSLVGPIIAIAIFGTLLAFAVFLQILSYQIMRSM